jgi:hypothetical protein
MIRSLAPSVGDPAGTRSGLASAHRDVPAPSASEACGPQEERTPACVGAASEPRLRYPSWSTAPRGTSRGGRRWRGHARIRRARDEAEYLCKCSPPCLEDRSNS